MKSVTSARVARSAVPLAPAKAPAVPQAGERRTGEPLDLETRTLMEARFGHDFGRVRVHHDGRAAQRAAAYAAAAYTLGDDVHFAAGRYRPRTGAGRALIAHELAHVVQQHSAAQGASAAAALLPADSAAERSADDAATRVLHGLAAPALAATPLGIARQPARKTAGSSGHLKADSNWSYIVYADEVKLRYFLDLPKEQADKRKEKGLPGFVQVGTIPWVTNNPGNITQTEGAATSTLQGFPADLGSMGVYGGRYSIFASKQAGKEAIGSYLSKLPSFGKNTDLSMAATIKQYKGEEPGEKAKREAREKENAERAKEGKPALPRVDVREAYLADVKQRMQQKMAAAEAMEVGEELSGLTAKQRRALDAEIKERVERFMSGRAADAPADEETLHAAVEGIYEVEGKAGAPGVTFTCKGFDDPTTRAIYDGEQKGIIRKLRESEPAKAELRALLGCGGA